MLLGALPPTAAAAADEAEPHRVVYWSAKYIEEEGDRLYRDYLKLLVRLKVFNLLLAPARRRA
jgi:hypothetical protein